MKANKLVKKLGYNVGIHFNEYKNLFEVYRIGTYAPGSQPREDSKLVTAKKLKKAAKKYMKKY